MPCPLTLNSAFLITSIFCCNLTAVYFFGLTLSHCLPAQSCPPTHCIWHLGHLSLLSTVLSPAEHCSYLHPALLNAHYLLCGLAEDHFEWFHGQAEFLQPYKIHLLVLSEPYWNISAPLKLICSCFGPSTSTDSLLVARKLFLNSFPLLPSHFPQEPQSISSSPCSTSSAASQVGITWGSVANLNSQGCGRGLMCCPIFPCHSLTDPQECQLTGYSLTLQTMSFWDF